MAQAIAGRRNRKVLREYAWRRSSASVWTAPRLRGCFIKPVQPTRERIGAIGGRWIDGPRGRRILAGYPVAIAMLCCQGLRRL